MCGVHVDISTLVYYLKSLAFQKPTVMVLAVVQLSVIYDVSYAE